MSQSELQAGMRQDVFTLDSGVAAIQWPRTLTIEEYDDFRQWLELIIRKTNPVRAVATIDDLLDSEVVADKDGNIISDGFSGPLNQAVANRASEDL